MAYEVLARKWRPKLLEDVVGQEHVTRTLANAIQSDRIAHAYLFIGPRGIGKTSLSRIFAKALNCETGPTAKPCLTCDSCVGIDNDASLDVIEMDAASNNSVEDIRTICDQVQFPPIKGRFRIFIIDEVHMLSKQAFNALLKTLEEPPSYVKFIFATTEGDKVLPTIISRCQRFDLRRIQISDIVKRLRFICGEEQIAITDDALLAIARGANGGLRDALSALDQLIAFKGADLKEEDVLSVFGLISREALEQLAKAIITGDIAEILRRIDGFDQTGKDLRRSLAELVNHFRNILVYQQAGEAVMRQESTDEQMVVLADQSALIDPKRILSITEILSEAEAQLRFALSLRAQVEMTLIKCARAAQTIPIDEAIKRLTQLRDQIIQRLAAGAASPAANPAGSVRPANPVQMTEPSASAPTSTEPAPQTAAQPAAQKQRMTEQIYSDEVVNATIAIFGATPISVDQH